MKEQILLFELNENPQKLLISQALLPLHVTLKFISPLQYLQTLGELTTSDESVPPSTASGAAALAAADPQLQNAVFQALPAPMIVFAGLSPQHFDDALAALRQTKLALPYKAVLTPHNAAWTPAQLFRELDRERAAIAQMKNDKGSR